MKLQSFTFNYFSENTYVLFDESKECVIIDPGCHQPEEEQKLVQFIEGNHLIPKRLIQTHCHIDHIFGNKFVFDKWGLLPEYHELEQKVLSSAVEYVKMWGIDYKPSPIGVLRLDVNQEVTFGNTSLKLLFTPGHSPGSVCFYHKESNQIISGDVLFRMSIGRTDLPGGNYETLMQSIFQQLLTLPDETKVYSGHGPVTTIGFEKKNNPFLI